MVRKVKYARTQTSVYVSGAAELGNVFPPQNKSLTDLDMSCDGSTLSVKFSYKGIKKELSIPYGNIVVLDLDLESKKA